VSDNIITVITNVLLFYFSKEYSLYTLRLSNITSTFRYEHTIDP